MIQKLKKHLKKILFTIFIGGVAFASVGQEPEWQLCGSAVSQTESRDAQGKITEIRIKYAHCEEERVFDKYGNQKGKTPSLQNLPEPAREAIQQNWRDKGHNVFMETDENGIEYIYFTI